MYEQLVKGDTPAAEEKTEEVPTKAHLETYEERWLRRLADNDPLKAMMIQKTPLFRVALDGIGPFNPPNGNKGLAYADRNFEEKK